MLNPRTEQVTSLSQGLAGRKRRGVMHEPCGESLQETSRSRMSTYDRLVFESCFMTRVTIHVSGVPVEANLLIMPSRSCLFFSAP